jgi:hypothetical protein
VVIGVQAKDVRMFLGMDQLAAASLNV